MIKGLNKKTGRSISSTDHLQQSVTDILTTPIGSRVMRREYGSYLFELIDTAGNPAGKLRLIAAATDALVRWEPRLQIKRISLSIAVDAYAELQIEAANQDSVLELKISNA